MPIKPGIKKVLVIGSGPIIIGQAAEFDYAGTQACKSLKEEGLEVVLVNSNPATIMTDAHMAQRIYIEPLDVETLSRIIEKERPDGLVPNLGGQTGLNLAVELSVSGVLERYGVKLLGTSVASIKKAEDRELFKATMLEIGEPVPESTIVTDLEAAQAFAREIGFPIIVRPAYTMGGTGGGIVKNHEELLRICDLGLKSSLIGQVLLERSVAGFKEIEYEVMRDAADNCITICNMENFDPVGIHTGDSIVIAPCQTLSDRENQMLRRASLNIIRALKVEGGCNVQYALDPASMKYYVIEVNPRVSRSSALASKATGYPIAKIAAKIAVGLHLDEIMNPVTGKTSACFEPALDYVVVKIPRWPFDKFGYAERSLGTQMKATGEVMALDRTFEAALNKAVRSLEIGVYGLRTQDSFQWTEMEIEDRIIRATDDRLFAIAEALRRKWTIREIHLISGIDYWFLHKVKNIIALEEKIQKEQFTRELLLEAKGSGMSDYQIAKLAGIKTQMIRDIRKTYQMLPAYKKVDTCAAEFQAESAYYYSTYEQENESWNSGRQKVLVLGSGPIRIGQGIEFDYCSVHSVWALKEAGMEAIIINNNPETVSTDFDTSDKLYFEPLTLEDVFNVIDLEQPKGVIVQFGGQTAINLAPGLEEHRVPILGTPVKYIDMAEDRKKFEQLLHSIGIPQSEGATADCVTEAVRIADHLGYPVLVRPSYVIGGRAMEVVHNENDLMNYMENAVQVSPKHPVLVDKYILGKEVDVDAVSDGQDVFIPSIIEHIERAGVHSGDSMAVFPPQTLNRGEIDQIVDYTEKIARALHVQGLVNIQFVIKNGRVYVLEVNPRASRTVPILSKVTGVPMVQIATRIMLGSSLRDLGYPGGLGKQPEFATVKAPVFSSEKLTQVDISLGPEMKSTGEVLGIDHDFGRAVYKAMRGAGMKLSPEGNVLFSVAEKDLSETADVAEAFAKAGYRLMASGKTADVLREAGLDVKKVELKQDLDVLMKRIARGEIALVINTPTKGKMMERAGFQLRRVAADYRVPCLTSLDTALAYLMAVQAVQGGVPECLPIQYYLSLQQRI